MNDLDTNPLVFADATGAATQTQSNATTARWTERLCQKLVLRSFEPMTRGRMTVRLPDGSSVRFGTGVAGPEAELHIRRHRFFLRGVLQGDIGFGEAFQDGDWTTPDLTAVIGWFCANRDHAPSMSGSRARDWHLGFMQGLNRIRHRINKNSLRGSRTNIQAHYDLGNDFYSLWLDPTMTYSAALFESPDQMLADAQTAKYDRLCRQLRLEPGDEVLEIGSGWGGFTEHAVTRYGCRVTTVTLSDEQARHCTQRFERGGYADRARVEIRDYRHIQGQFDKICSIEMLEAVGDEFLETYFRQVQARLKPHGRFAAQFITCPDNRHEELRNGVDWIQKHIFPGSLLLSMNRVGEVVQRTGDLWLEDLHDMGIDYARTLHLWRDRFHQSLGAVRQLGFDDRFIRTWDYYLAYCEAAFAWRNISVVQATWSRPGQADCPRYLA